MGARRALLLNHAYVSQLFGLVVWFLLWLREVPGSIPASCAHWRLLAPRGAAGHVLAALSLAAPGTSFSFSLSLSLSLSRALCLSLSLSGS